MGLYAGSTFGESQKVKICTRQTEKVEPFPKAELVQKLDAQDPTTQKIYAQSTTREIDIKGGLDRDRTEADGE